MVTKLELPAVDLKHALIWPRAERYVVAAGWISPEGARREEDRKSTRRYINLDIPTPLSDVDLLRSFTKLGDRGRPTNRRIREWVSRYGLLQRENNDRDGNTDLDDGQVNQKPMLVERFVQEVFFVRDLQNLYHDIRVGDLDNIRRKINNPSSDVERALAADKLARLAAGPPSAPAPSTRDPFEYLEHLLATIPSTISHATAKMTLNLQGSLTRAPDGLVLHGDRVLGNLLTSKLDRVQLRVTSGFSPPEELASQPLASIESPEFASAMQPPPRYQPLISWSCPDLLSAIYLQLVLLITNNRPMRLCAFDKCNTPFSPSRKDKKYCTKGCKEQDREERKRKT